MTPRSSLFFLASLANDFEMFRDVLLVGKSKSSNFLNVLSLVVSLDFRGLYVARRSVKHG